MERSDLDVVRARCFGREREGLGSSVRSVDRADQLPVGPKESDHDVGADLIDLADNDHVRFEVERVVVVLAG